MDPESAHGNTSNEVYYGYIMHEAIVSPPFSDETFTLIELILAMATIGTVAAFGIMTNSINLILFYRQGILSHSCTASLTTLAVSDFFYSLLTFWGSLCLYLYFIQFESWNINYKIMFIDFYTYTSLRPAVMFSDINCGVTAFIAFERLFSVTFPFRVKAIFTARRSCVVLSCIVGGTFIYYIPNNFELIPKWYFSYQTNSSIVSYGRNALMPGVMVQLYIDSRVFLRTAVAFFVVLCNVGVSLKVILSKRFRKSSASTTTHTVSSSCRDPSTIKQNKRNDGKTNKETTDSSYNENKEMKLLRMMMVICILFGSCYIVDFVFVLVFDLSGLEYMIDYHQYTYYTVLNVMFLFQTINASCNFFIYYNMSTRYREDLRFILCTWKQ